MRRILLVTNIISPYRQHLFNAWAADCQRRGLELNVAFMSRGEADRNWDPADYPLNCDHHFYWGIHIPWPKRFKVLHLNPGLLWTLLSGRWDAVVFGGYKDPTQLLAMVLPKRKRLWILWSESNRYSEGLTNPLWRRIKKLAIARCDAYLVPGQWARDYLECLCAESRERSFITLPNTVNDPLFRAARETSPESKATYLSAMDIPRDNKVLIFVGRLEERKGIEQVVNAVRDTNAPLTLLIVGEGPLDQELRRIAAESKLDIRLLGYKDESDVKHLMAMSDALLLPSLNDPWPLVVVEALMSGLPVLLSNRVGNVADLVNGRGTGWVFDVFSHDSIREAIQQLAHVDREVLAEKGRAAAQLADSELATEPVVARLNESLESLLRDRAKRG